MSRKRERAEQAYEYARHELAELAYEVARKSLARARVWAHSSGLTQFTRQELLELGAFETLDILVAREDRIE